MWDMSSFNVVPVAIADTAMRIATIPGGVEEAHGRLGGLGAAAAGTPAAGALDDLLGRWSAALPRFGLSAQSLAVAVAAAGHAYSSADSAVAGAAAGPQSRSGR